MEKATGFFAMHGYAAYVWPSFIVAVLVMAAMAAASLRSLRKAQRTLAELQRSPQNEA